MAKTKFFTRIKNMVRPSTADFYMGRSVYLEDSGAEIGRIVNMSKSSVGTIMAFDIQSNGTGSSVQYSAENVVQRGNKLVLIPTWYIDARKKVSRLERYESTNRDLALLLTREEYTPEKVTEISKMDPALSNLIEEGISLREGLTKRMISLEKERGNISIENDEMTQTRDLGKISTEEYSTKVLELQMNMQTVNVNMKRCEELLMRLRHSPFLPSEKTLQRLRENPVDSLNLPHGKSADGKGPGKRSNKIKKIRVLKLEKDIQQLTDELRKSERELKLNYEVEYNRNRLSDVEDELRRIADQLETTGQMDPKLMDFLTSRKEELLRYKRDLVERLNEIEEMKETGDFSGIDLNT